MQVKAGAMQVAPNPRPTLAIRTWKPELGIPKRVIIEFIWHRILVVTLDHLPNFHFLVLIRLNDLIRDGLGSVNFTP